MQQGCWGPPALTSPSPGKARRGQGALGQQPHSCTELACAQPWPCHGRKPSQEPVSQERDGWSLPTPPLYI